MSGPGFRYDTVSLPSQADFALRRNAEPPGLHSELHYHDHYELLFCFTGQLPYRVEGSAFLLESGSVLLIHPYQLHQSMPAQGNAERIALRFRRSVLEQRGETLIQMFLEQAPRHKNLLVLEAKSQRVIYRILNDMLREQTEDGFGRTQVEDALLTQMLFYLARAAGPLPSDKLRGAAGAAGHRIPGRPPGGRKLPAPAGRAVLHRPIPPLSLLFPAGGLPASPLPDL